MDIPNKEEVLSGTAQKKFNQKYEQMATNYNEETAEDFYNSYKDEDLSFILNNLNLILSDGYFGISFIQNIVDGCYIPFYRLTEVKDIVNDKLEKAKKEKVSWEQEKEYSDLRNSLSTFIEGFANTINLCNIACKNGGKEMIDISFDYFYEIGRNGSDEEYCTLIDDIASNCIEPYTRISLFAYIIFNNNHQYPFYKDFTMRPYVNNDGKEPEVIMTEEKRFNMDIMRAISIIGKDSIIIESLEALPFNTRIYLKGMIDEGLKKPELTYTETASHFLGLTMALEDIYECSYGDSIANDVNKCKKYDYLKSLKTYYESCRDFEILSAENESDVEAVVEKYEDYIDDISADISFMEWTENGEPDSAIKNHIMTQKEINAEKEKEKEKKDKAKKEAIEKTKEETEDEDFLEDDENKDWKEADSENSSIRKKVIDSCIKVVLSSDIKSSKDNSGINTLKKDFIKGEGSTQWLGFYNHKEDANKVLKELKESIKKYTDDFEVFIFSDGYKKDECDIFLRVKKNSKYYIEPRYEYAIFIEASKNTDKEVEEFRKEIHGEKKDDVKPQKPKEDFPTKIQNKALDAEAARQQKRGIRQEKNTKLKNAGKAIMSGPKGWFNSVKKFTDSFNKMDVKRRKEFFLKPGYRHKIFRNAKWALLYGGAAKYKLTSIPFVMLIRHFSKDKDRRIRNELTRELESEIRICEEKINDANANGDQQEKYKLMRIKDKLSAEKNRVQLNSNYI